MIRDSRFFLLPLMLWFVFAGISFPSEGSNRNDSIATEVKTEFQPENRTQQELLKVFAKGRIERKRNPDLALKYYKDFYEKSVKAGEPYYAAAAYFEICRVYMDRQLYFTAMEYSLRAYQILLDNNLEYRSNYFMIGIGNCYFQTGNYMIAEGYFRKAETLFLSCKDYFGIAVAENNIGLVKQKLNQKDSALWYFQKALEQRRKTNNPAIIGHSYYYLGSAKLSMGKLDEARKYFEMSVPLLYISSDNIFLRHDFSSTMADVYFELGKLNDLENKHAEAIKDYCKAISICDTILEQFKMPDIYIAMGQSYLRSGDYGHALGSYRDALRIADSGSLLNMKKICYENMMHVFLLNRQNDSVASYLAMYSAVTNTLQAQMIDSRFNEIRLALKIGETENEARELRVRNTYTISFLITTGILMLLLILLSLAYIIKQRKNAKVAIEEIRARKKAEEDLEKLNLELKAINADKDRFISILSHDLRSPFNALIGFADLLVEETADKNIPEIRHYSRMVQQISKGTFQLLENLLTWSRLQIGTMPFQPANLELYREVSAVIDVMMAIASRKSIRIRNLVSADAIVFADSIMLQAVIRNLISNAVKFTKSEGNIEIRSELKDGFQVVTVSDNGIGVSEEITGKLFSDSHGMVSTNGTDNEKGHGLGLPLCRYMIEKTGGRIWLEATSEKGSIFAFTIPEVNG